MTDRTIGIGMLGYGFMGRAHSSALRQLRHMTWPPPLIPELVSIAGRTEEAVAAAGEAFGFAEHVTDWRAVIADPRVGLFDNTELHHFLAAIRDDGDVAPLGATFEDGYRAAEVCDAIVRSAVARARMAIQYR